MIIWIILILSISKQLIDSTCTCVTAFELKIVLNLATDFNSLFIYKWNSYCLLDRLNFINAWVKDLSYNNFFESWYSTICCCFQKEGFSFYCSIISIDYYIVIATYLNQGVILYNCPCWLSHKLEFLELAFSFCNSIWIFNFEPCFVKDRVDLNLLAWIEIILNDVDRMDLVRLPFYSFFSTNNDVKLCLVTYLRFGECANCKYKRVYSFILFSYCKV